MRDFAGTHTAGDGGNMAQAKQAVERPLSPHLSIYRPLINMVMSILHRITGVGALRRHAAAGGLAGRGGHRPATPTPGQRAVRHPLGKLVLFGYTWALIHHMLGGIRHLIWDTGRGFDLAGRRLSWADLIGSVVLTGDLGRWLLALRGAC